MGTLVLGNAEFLALSTLIQSIRPGAPMIYAVLSTVADMRTGDYAPGAIETGILQMAHTEMARFYNVPSGGYIGLTNSHCNDAQSGYETGMNVTAALLAGADLFNMGGLLSSLMTFDYAKAVIDNEIALMLKRITRGMEFSKENMCLDLIKEVGPGGNYMDKMHTLKNMKTTAVLPKVANRQGRGHWEEEGRPDSHARALAEAKKILMQDNPARFPAELDAKIRSHFPGIVPGDCKW
jgi:trimethylamine--corrinoid protein Co-methyltransferase